MKLGVYCIHYNLPTYRLYCDCHVEDIHFSQAMARDRCLFQNCLLKTRACDVRLYPLYSDLGIFEYRCCSSCPSDGEPCHSPVVVAKLDFYLEIIWRKLTFIFVLTVIVMLYHLIVHFGLGDHGVKYGSFKILIAVSLVESKVVTETVEL